MYYSHGVEQLTPRRRVEKAFDNITTTATSFLFQTKMKRGKQTDYKGKSSSKQRRMMEFIRYDTKNVLSKGRFGIMFRGTYQQEEGKEPVPVAVIKKKIFQYSNAKDEEENDLIIKLDHINVAKLYQVEDQQEDVRCYAPELCDASLDSFFERKYSGPIPSPANVLLQLSSGLQYIHESNVAHRNISPRSALYSVKDRQMKWCLLRHTVMGSQHPESFAFWAPEIISRYVPYGGTSSNDVQQHTVASNIFAVGCVFAQFLTGGLHPFGEYRQKVMLMMGTDANDVSRQTTNSDENANSQAWKNCEDDVNKTEIKTDCNVGRHHQQSTEKFNYSGQNSQVVSNIYVNNPVNLGRLSSHYAYDFIRKMLENSQERRMGALKELIDHIISTIKVETEFHDLCSLANPTKEEQRQMQRMLQCDDELDINRVDHEGNTPLILLCRNRRGNDLKQSIQTLHRKPEASDVGRKQEEQHRIQRPPLRLHELQSTQFEPVGYTRVARHKNYRLEHSGPSRHGSSSLPLQILPARQPERYCRTIDGKESWAQHCQTRTQQMDSASFLVSPPKLN